MHPIREPIIPVAFRRCRVVFVIFRVGPSEALGVMRFFGVLRSTTVTMPGTAAWTASVVSRTGTSSLRSWVPRSVASGIDYLSILRVSQVGSRKGGFGGKVPPIPPM
jgi:hypothetical protein